MGNVSKKATQQANELKNEKEKNERDAKGRTETKGDTASPEADAPETTDED